MAARSKPYEFLRCLRIEGQHADGTGPGLEFGHAPKRATVTQHWRSGRATKHDSFRQPAQPLAQSVLQPGGGESGSEPVLQSANFRRLHPALAERFTRERLRRHQQRGRDAGLQQSRLSQPRRWRRRTLRCRPWALTLDNEQSIKTFMKSLSNPTAPALLHDTLAFTLALAVSASLTLQAAETGRTFATPEAAVAALASAVSTTNQAELHAIFGPVTDDLVNPDAVQAANEFASFAAALAETNHLTRESDTRRILELGNAAWPFPVPIVQKDGRWFFDTAAGKEEIVNRRIGRNELSALKVVRAYVEAQREYASRDRDGDGVLKYAQKIISTPGAKDGLFWSPDFDGEISPLGPLAADAAAEGYHKGKKVPGDEPQPFHGYLFKILTRQGKHAPGGKYDYIINGNMIGGFALVALPAEYGQSGMMTFIVNQQGRVYQKDLGPMTAKIAGTMRAYDPDKTWTISPD